MNEKQSTLIVALEPNGQRASNLNREELAEHIRNRPITNLDLGARLNKVSLANDRK